MANDAHVLSINRFNQPQIYKNEESEYINIIYLILLKKGTFQSHPDMGVGLRERYRYNNSSSLEYDLSNDIARQINTYLPYLSPANVSIKIMPNHVLEITIDTRETEYILTYDQTNNSITTVDNAVYSLSDL